MYFVFAYNEALTKIASQREIQCTNVIRAYMVLH